MKKMCLVFVFLFIISFLAFGQTEEQEEIDYLLFSPNSSSSFVDEEQASVQLDKMANYLIGREIADGQIIVYGYAAVVPNDIEPLALSKNRALFVLNELQRRGVPRSLFSEPIGNGEVNLWGSNETEENRSPNRRARVVLGKNIIIVQQSTGEVIESEIPAVVQEVEETEIIISSVEIDETPAVKKPQTSAPKSKFPWWILIPLILLLLLPFILSKLKKGKAEKPAKSERAEKPAPIPAAASEDDEPQLILTVLPVETSEESKPQAAPTRASEDKPQAIPTTASENSKPQTVPAAASEDKPQAVTTAASEKSKPHFIPSIFSAASKSAEPAVVTTESVVYLEEEIRCLAYEYSAQRNFENGSMDDDWYRALPVIRAKYESAGYQTYTDGCWWAKKTFVSRA